MWYIKMIVMEEADISNFEFHLHFEENGDEMQMRIFRQNVIADEM